LRINNQQQPPNFAAPSTANAAVFLAGLQNQQALGGHISAATLPQRSALAQLVQFTYKSQLEKPDAAKFLDELVAQVQKKPAPESNTLLLQVLKLYPTIIEAVETVAYLLLDLRQRGEKSLEVLKYMYRTFTPFRYSLENKETALIIRNKRVVDDYTRDITNPQQRQLLENTEKEAKLATQWILRITEQERLEAKTLTQNFNSSELFLLHRIQAKWMREYRSIQKQIADAKGTPNASNIRQFQKQLRKLDTFIQMSILAISEALGFGG